jgi:hypothetical protein
MNIEMSRETLLILIFFSKNSDFSIVRSAKTKTKIDTSLVAK